jgi:hypothetical protein
MPVTNGKRLGTIIYTIRAEMLTETGINKELVELEREAIILFIVLM